MLSVLAHSPSVHVAVLGMLTGVLGAAKTDYDAFTHWKSFHDAADYGWSTALFRWVQGAIIGGVTGAAAGLTAAGFGGRI